MPKESMAGEGDEASNRWSRYWAAGHAHSCPTSFDGFYGPDIQAFWKGRCGKLTPADALLDLGCGNGGLLSFLLECFPQGSGPAMFGVDAATLRPVLPEGSAVRRPVLHGQTRFSRLPLEPASVSMAVSQFGFEYGDEDAAWTELFRVLRPRASVVFIAHKRGSVLDAVAADEAAVAEAALSDRGLFESAALLAPYLKQASTPAGRRELESDPRATAAREQYNAAVDVLANLAQLLKHGQYARDILESVTDVLSVAQTVAIGETQARLDRLRDQLTDHVGRISELRRCALDAPRVQAWKDRLVDAGFRMKDTGVLFEGPHEMGWIVEGERDARR